MDRVLVTGGAGFVGHHLVRRFLQLGHAVHVLDDLSSGTPSNISAEAVFFKGDIRDMDMVRKAIHSCSAVIHLAARVELQKSMLLPAPFIPSIRTSLFPMTWRRLEKHLMPFRSVRASRL